MVAGDDAVPAQHAHIAKGVASADRNRAGRADGQLHAAVGQRVPDAVKHLLEDNQLDVRKVAIKINNHLPHPRRLNDIVNRDRELPAPAVGDLLTLAAGDLHFLITERPSCKNHTPAG